MNFRSVWAAVALLYGCTFGGSAGAAETLTMTGSLWTPYVDADLPEGGLASDLVRTALTKAGYEVAVKVEPWSRAYEGVALGIYDVVPAVWRTAERDKDMLFSEPYLYNDVVLLSRSGVLVKFDTLEDLTGYRIGVVRDYAYDEAFDSHPALDRVYNNQLIQNLLLLQQNKLVLVVADRLAARALITTYLPDQKDQFVVLPKPLSRRGLGIGISRQNPDAAGIIAKFDSAMAQMKADGSYSRIVEKHTSMLLELPALQ